MDEQAQKQLNTILSKEPNELNENEKAVLRARVHYVGRNSRAKFADILAEKPQEQPEEQEVAEEEKKSDTSTHPADQAADQENPDETSDSDEEDEE